MSSQEAVDHGRALVLEHFRWIDGAADTWSVLRSADALAGIVAGLAALVERPTARDYRGNRRTLAARRDLFSPGQRVVLVDDWIETGSQAVAAAGLVAEAGAELVGVAVVVDEASPAARAALPALRGLVRSSELPPPG